MEASGVCLEGGHELRGQVQERWANAFLSFQVLSLRSQLNWKSFKGKVGMYLNLPGLVSSLRDAKCISHIGMKNTSSQENIVARLEMIFYAPKNV